MAPQLRMSSFQTGLFVRKKNFSLTQHQEGNCGKDSALLFFHIAATWKYLGTFCWLTKTLLLHCQQIWLPNFIMWFLALRAVQNLMPDNRKWSVYVYCFASAKWALISSNRTEHSVTEGWISLDTGWSSMYVYRADFIYICISFYLNFKKLRGDVYNGSVHTKINAALQSISELGIWVYAVNSRV